MKKWKKLRLFFVLLFIQLFYSAQGKWCTNKKLNATTSGIHTHSFYKNNFLELQIQKQLLSVSPNILIELFTGYLIIV